MEFHVGNRMETDKVDPAIDIADEPYELVGVGDIVVDSAPHYVFKRETALMAEIVACEHTHDALDRKCLHG